MRPSTTGATASSTEAAGARPGRELPSIRVRPPGPRSRDLASRLAAVECPAADARRQARARQSDTDATPIVYARGAGANVIDVDDNRYVDLAAGFGALLLGHVPAAPWQERV